MLFTTVFFALVAAGTCLSAALPLTHDASPVRAAKRLPLPVPESNGDPAGESSGTDSQDAGAADSSDAGAANRQVTNSIPDGPRSGGAAGDGTANSLPNGPNGGGDAGVNGDPVGDPAGGAASGKPGAGTGR